MAAVESRTCPLPIPFSVRTLAPPDLLAIKLAGLLTRRYYRRPKGRDWYDMFWCAAHQPRLNVAHLEARLRQAGWMPPGERPTGDGKQPGGEAHSTGEGEGPGSKGGVLTGTGVLKMAEKVIKILDVEEARREVLPYLSDPGTVAAWSPEFFREAFCRIAMGDVLAAPDGS